MDRENEYDDFGAGDYVMNRLPGNCMTQFNSHRRLPDESRKGLTVSHCVRGPDLHHDPLTTIDFSSQRLDLVLLLIVLTVVNLIFKSHTRFQAAFISE